MSKVTRICLFNNVSEYVSKCRLKKTCLQKCLESVFWKKYVSKSVSKVSPFKYMSPNMSPLHGSVDVVCWRACTTLRHVPRDAPAAGRSPATAARPAETPRRRGQPRRRGTFTGCNPAQEMRQGTGHWTKTTQGRWPCADMGK